MPCNPAMPPAQVAIDPPPPPHAEPPHQAAHKRADPLRLAGASSESPVRAGGNRKINGAPERAEGQTVTEDQKRLGERLDPRIECSRLKVVPRLPCHREYAIEEQERDHETRGESTEISVPEPHEPFP